MSRKDRTMLFRTVDFVRCLRKAVGHAGHVDVIVRTSNRDTYMELRRAFQAMGQEAVDWFPEAQSLDMQTAIEIEGIKVGIMLGDE